MAQAKAGDKVSVHFTGSLEDGSIFGSTQKEEPFEFIIGQKNVLPGFEDAVIGMEEGDEKEFKLEPSDAYGDHNPELTKEIPRSQLPPDEKLEPGMVLIMNLPNGFQINANITEVSDETITIDLNHPLAGKTLSFKVKILEISS